MIIIQVGAFRFRALRQMKHSSTKSTATLCPHAQAGWLARQLVDFQMRMALAGKAIGVSVSSVTEHRFFHVTASAIRRNLADHPEEMTYFLEHSTSCATLAGEVLAVVLSLSPQARFARPLMLLRLESGTGQSTQRQRNLTAWPG